MNSDHPTYTRGLHNRRQSCLRPGVPVPTRLVISDPKGQESELGLSPREYACASHKRHGVPGCRCLTSSGGGVGAAFYAAGQPAGFPSVLPVVPGETMVGPRRRTLPPLCELPSMLPALSAASRPTAGMRSVAGGRSQPRGAPRFGANVSPPTQAHWQ